MKKIINYSGIAGLVLISALFFLPFSCNKDTVENNPNADSNSQLIKVSGEDANAATKTTLNELVTSWVATTDKIGIYSTEARTASGSGSPIVNAQFTAASNGVSSNFTGTMYWGTGTATSHTFYAYYPWVSGTAASTAVPVSLSSAQTQSAAGSNAHIGALDFMVATPVTVTSPDNTDAVANEVNLRYNHVFTVLEFQIKGTGQLKAVKLSGSNALAFSGGTVDITQATPATGVAYTIAGQTGINQVEVTLTTPANLSTSTATTVYMVINPGTQTGNCSIGLSSEGTTWAYISKAAPGGGFLRGQKYVVSVNAATASVSIGDSYQGGKVFYILQPSDPGYVSGETHGLIAATADQGTSIAWWNGSYTTTGATGTALGTGSANTTAIIASQGNTGSYAAKICRDYTDGVYHDWYLPSKDELNKLYLQKSAVGGFANDYYWSSTQDGKFSARIQSFYSGGQAILSSNLQYYVRAIRAF